MLQIETSPPSQVPNVSICTSKTFSRPLNVTDLDKPAAPKHSSRSVTDRPVFCPQTLQIETKRQKAGQATTTHPLPPFLLVDVERLYVPPLGAHDVADQPQEEADARGVKAVLQILGMHRTRPVDRRVVQARDVI